MAKVFIKFSLQSCQTKNNDNYVERYTAVKETDKQLK